MTAIETHLLFMDPKWVPVAEDEAPPVTALAGSWRVGTDGEISAFIPNPGYRPSDPDAPADPLDALLRSAAPGTPPVELVRLLLRDAVLDVALDERGEPLLVYSPDGALCVIVATSAPQRDLAPVPGWRSTDLLGLITLLDDGVDVLANPYGPVAARIRADDVRAAWLLDDDALERARTQLRERYPPRDTAALTWFDRPSGQPAAGLRADAAPEGRPGAGRARDW